MGKGKFLVRDKRLSGKRTASKPINSMASSSSTVEMHIYAKGKQIYGVEEVWGEREGQGESERGLLT